MPKALLGAALAAVIAGCSPGSAVEPTPAPSPTPSVVASPSPSPSPDRDALYAEAERVVRRATQLEEEAINNGPGSYSPELEALLADPYLSLSRSGVKQYWDLGWKQKAGESAGLILRPQPGVSRDGSDVALEACFIRTSTVDANGTLVASGEMVQRQYFFKLIDNDLMLFTATTGKKVEQCPFQ